MSHRKVTTHRRRFVHKRATASNTLCGALPKYYGPGHLIDVTDEEAAKMHHCRRCFPPST